MALSRELNLALNWVLNEVIPPFIRDRRWFGWMITRLLYKDKAPIYMAFHERVYEMSDAEFAEAYREIQSTALARPTDLNQHSIDLIRQHMLVGPVLEVGCGRGYLSGILAADGHAVTGCDVALADGLATKFPGVTFMQSPAETLPFADGAFDNVVSTHMLEHVRDLAAVLAELRRVAKRRLVIVVPRERPHFYTPNLHIHFFPYRFSLLLAFKPKPGSYRLEDAKGDWFYVEEKAND
ncbi:MAG: class I SAM-dependent methyltransferase [Rickettsiales bacterium]